MDKIISSSPSLLHGSSSGSPIGATWGDVKHPNLSPQAMEIVGKHAPRSAPKHKLKVRSSSSPPTSRRVSYGQGQGSELASHTMHHELYDVASGIGGISVKRRRLDDGTAETDIAMPSWVINTLVKRVVRAMRGKPKSGASQGSDKDVPNVPMDSQPEPQSEDARSEAATGVVGAVLSQLRRQLAAHGEELLLLKGEHQVLGSEATKAMEVAREASQKAQLASETAGRSAATAKGANTRTTALRDDVSHINKRLDEHEAATRADREALRGRIQALEEANAAGGSHSPPSDAAAEVRAAKVTMEATKRDVAAMSADVKAAVAAGELLRGTKAILEGLQVEVRSARSGGAQHTKDIIEITETVRNVTETATLALQGAEEATAAIDKIKRDAAATRETAIANNKSIDTTTRDVEAAWSDIAGLRDDVKKIEAAAEVSNQTLQRLRRDTDANVKTANSDAKAASQRAATAQGAADEARTDAAALRRELQAAQAQVETHAAAVQTAKREAADARQQAAAAGDAVKLLRQRIAAVEQENERRYNALQRASDTAQAAQQAEAERVRAQFQAVHSAKEDWQAAVAVEVDSLRGMQAELVKAPVANTSIGQASMHDSAGFAELVQEARKAALTAKSEADRAELMRSSVEQMQSLHRPAQEDAVGRAEAAALEARQVAVATREDCNTYVQNARRLAGDAQAAYERLAQQPPPPSPGPTPSGLDDFQQTAQRWLKECETH